MTYDISELDAEQLRGKFLVYDKHHDVIGDKCADTIDEAEATIKDWFAENYDEDEVAEAEVFILRPVARVNVTAFRISTELRMLH